MRLFYLRSGIVPGNQVQQQRLPYVTVSLERFDEMRRERPDVPLRDRPFRILRDYGQHLDLQWA